MTKAHSVGKSNNERFASVKSQGTNARVLSGERQKVPSSCEDTNLPSGVSIENIGDPTGRNPAIPERPLECAASFEEQTNKHSLLYKEVGIVMPAEIKRPRTADEMQREWNNVR